MFDLSGFQKIVVNARSLRRNEKLFYLIAYQGPRRDKSYRFQVSDEGIALTLIKNDDEQGDKVV